MLNEGIKEYLTSSGNINRFRRGHRDRKHFLIILSGFRHKGTLNFGDPTTGAIQHNEAYL